MGHCPLDTNTIVSFGNALDQLRALPSHWLHGNSILKIGLIALHKNTLPALGVVFVLLMDLKRKQEEEDCSNVLRCFE